MDKQKLEQIIKDLRTFSTPELCDGAGVYRSMHHSMSHRAGKMSFVGPAFTVEVPSGEGALVAEAINHASSGCVLVVSGHGNCDCSYWGDHRSICASLKGLEAVVIDGAFRDVEGCEEAGFTVFARGLTCGTAGKSGQGKLNVPVSCAGVTVNPGDLIVGDRNGVCVIDPEEAESIMEKARKKRELQEEVIRYMKRTGKIITSLKGLTVGQLEAEND